MHYAQIHYFRYRAEALGGEAGRVIDAEFREVTPNRETDTPPVTRLWQRVQRLLATIWR